MAHFVVFVAKKSTCGSGDFPEIFYKLDLTEIPMWSVTASRHNLAADISWLPLIWMCQTDKCVVAQGLKVVFIINLIIIDHSRIIQALRFIKISKYDDGGQLMSEANLCLKGALQQYFINKNISWPSPPHTPSPFPSWTGKPSPHATSMLLRKHEAPSGGTL